jgi:CelD/BcsL family acetyltransferase involved in cellulose biosynthesis
VSWPGAATTCAGVCAIARIGCAARTPSGCAQPPTRRWAGTTTVFSGPRIALHRALAAHAVDRGWLRLRLLELDGRPVAANYALRVGDAEWYYQAGRDPAHDRASVGFVLLAACVRAASEEGAREYRMLRGDEHYKRSWATRDAALETVLVDAG